MTGNCARPAQAAPQLAGILDADADPNAAVFSKGVKPLRGGKHHDLFNEEVTEEEQLVSMKIECI